MRPLSQLPGILSPLIRETIKELFSLARTKRSCGWLLVEWESVVRQIQSSSQRVLGYKQSFLCIYERFPLVFMNSLGSRPVL